MRTTSLLIPVAAVALAVGAAACNRSEPPAEATPELAAAAVSHGSTEVRWASSWDDAMSRARSEGKPVLVTFYADWCIWCRRLETTTFADQKVARMLAEQVIPVRLDVDAEGKAQSNQYEVDGLPTVLLVDADGSVKGRIPGYMPPAGFLETVRGFLAG